MVHIEKLFQYSITFLIYSHEEGETQIEVVEKYKNDF